jgi:hypothetical protein
VKNGNADNSKLTARLKFSIMIIDADANLVFNITQHTAVETALECHKKCLMFNDAD